jgi:hypothetical protein
MSIFKSTLAALVAAIAVIAMSSAAFAAAAGPLTIALTCDTGPNGSGTFTVTANGRFSTVTVRCDSRWTVTNPAWTAGSTALIHQTSWPAGTFQARDVSVTLRTTAQTVFIRNFRTTTTTTTTLARTGGGVPLVPVGAALVGLLLIGIGGRVLTGRRPGGVN